MIELLREFLPAQLRSRALASFFAAFVVAGSLTVAATLAVENARRDGLPDGSPSVPPERVDLYGDPLPEGVVARIGTIRLRQTGVVRSIAYSPDGKTIASATDGPRPPGQSLPAAIDFWDVETGRHLLSVPVEGTALAFSPDGARLALREIQEVRIFDIRIGAGICRFGAAGIRAVVYTPDGRRIIGWGGRWSTRDKAVVESTGTLQIFDAETGADLGAFEGHGGYVYAAMISADGTTLVSSSQDNTVRVWDVSTRREVARFRILEGIEPGEGVWLDSSQWSPIALAPGGRTLAVALSDSTVRIQELPSGREVRRLRGHTDSILALAFSRDGLRLVSGGRDQAPRIWSVETGQELHALRGHTSWVECVDFSPDGRTVASGSQDHSLKIWSVATGEEIHVAGSAPTSRINSAHLSPDGSLVATASNEDIGLWDAPTGRLLFRKELPDSSCVAFSPAGARLAVGNWNGTLSLWNVVRGETDVSLVLARRQEEQVGWLRGLAFSPDGGTIAAADSRGRCSVRLIDAGTLEERRQLVSEAQGGGQVIFSRDGKRLAVIAGSSNKVQVWESTAGMSDPRGTILALPAIQYTDCGQIAFTPSGELVTAEKAFPYVVRGGAEIPRPVEAPRRDAIRVWDPATGETVRLYRRSLESLLEDLGNPGKQGCVPRTAFAVAVSPDGRWIASAEQGNQLFVFDASSGAIVSKSPTYHRAPVTGLEFSTDGTRLFSHSQHDRTVLVRDVRQILEHTSP